MPKVWASMPWQSHKLCPCRGKIWRQVNSVYTLISFEKTTTLNQFCSAVPTHTMYIHRWFERSSDCTQEFNNCPLLLHFLYITFKGEIAAAGEPIPLKKGGLVQTYKMLGLKNCLQNQYWTSGSAQNRKPALPVSCIFWLGHFPRSNFFSSKNSF